VQIRTSAIALVALILLLVITGCSAEPTKNQAAANTNARPAATTSSAPAATPDEFAAARATYAQFCIRCHKPDASGGIFELDDGTKLKVPSLREGGALKDSDEEFVEQIQNGGDGMPPFKGKLEPEQITGLVKFIRHEFQSGAAHGASTSASPAR
jgi:cytochrome c551